MLMYWVLNHCSYLLFTLDFVMTLFRYKMDAKRKISYVSSLDYSSGGSTNWYIDFYHLNG